MFIERILFRCPKSPLVSNVQACDGFVRPAALSAVVQRTARTVQHQLPIDRKPIPNLLLKYWVQSNRLDWIDGANQMEYLTMIHLAWIGNCPMGHHHPVDELTLSIKQMALVVRFQAIAVAGRTMCSVLFPLALTSMVQFWSLHRAKQKRINQLLNTM